MTSPTLVEAADAALPKTLGNCREELLQKCARVRYVFTDLDGTLLGKGGSLFASGDGNPSDAQSRALYSLHLRGIEIVPISGRQREHIEPVAWVLGAKHFVAEAGTIVSVYDAKRRKSSLIRLYGAFDDLGFPDGVSPYEAMLESGVVDAVLSRNRGRVEHHVPWHKGRVASHLLRGEIDHEAETKALADRGLGWCRLVDNGIIPRSFPSLTVSRVHAYHLLPDRTGKGRGVAAVLDALGATRFEAVAIGDGRADLEIAPYVAAVFVPRHAPELDPTLAPEVASIDNAYVTDRPYGEGWAEAIATCLEARDRSAG